MQQKEAANPEQVPGSSGGCMSGLIQEGANDKEDT
jgi:hypothetical protein